jgi:hypothetical protein
MVEQACYKQSHELASETLLCCRDDQNTAVIRQLVQNDMSVGAEHISKPTVATLCSLRQALHARLLGPAHVKCCWLVTQMPPLVTLVTGAWLHTVCQLL